MKWQLWLPSTLSTMSTVKVIRLLENIIYIHLGELQNLHHHHHHRAVHHHSDQDQKIVSTLESEGIQPYLASSHGRNYTRHQYSLVCKSLGDVHQQMSWLPAKENIYWDIPSFHLKKWENKQSDDLCDRCRLCTHEKVDNHKSCTIMPMRAMNKNKFFRLLLPSQKL